MAKSVKTLQLPFALVELAKQHFKTENASLVICSSIESAIMHCKLPIPDESCEIYHLLSIEERRAMKKYSVRIEDYAVKALLSVSNQSLNEAITTTIVLTLSTDRSIASLQPLKLINILGSKWDKRMQSAIKHVIANRSWLNSYETCVGALGIHANFELAGTELINDDDVEKINLYTCIQQYAFEFKCKVLTFGCSKADFTKIKDEDYSNSIIPNVDRAVQFFILNYFSTRNTGNTYSKKSKQTLCHRLEAIAPLSARLKNVHITNEDIFDVISRHKQKSDALFIVDPIYLDTNVYKSRTIGTKTKHGKEFGWNEHKRLAKELRSIKGDFIYFCRITASRHKDKNHKLIDSPETLQRKDIEMQGRIDDLYWGYGFHYMDVSLDDGTIERIITSFDFEGSTPYGNIVEVEVV